MTTGGTKDTDDSAKTMQPAAMGKQGAQACWPDGVYVNGVMLGAFRFVDAKGKDFAEKLFNSPTCKDTRRFSKPKVAQTQVSRQGSLPPCSGSASLAVVLMVPRVLSSIAGLPLRQTEG